MNKTGQYIINQKNILSIYFTAGHPLPGSTIEIINALQLSGVGLIEIGIPFSDPMADGPVIQKSNQRALENGFTLDQLFDELKTIQPTIKIPLVLMGYFNTVLAYGVEKFLKKCQSVGIDTVILPDLPPEVYLLRYADLFRQCEVSPVFLITPQTDTVRIEFINSLSNAFIYAVAQNSITGSTNEISDQQLQYFRRIKETPLDVPIMIGFGVSDHKAYIQACEYAAGAIIGSAFIRAIENTNNINKTISQFIHSIKHATQ